MSSENELEPGTSHHDHYASSQIAFDLGSRLAGGYTADENDDLKDALGHSSEDEAPVQKKPPPPKPPSAPAAPPIPPHHYLIPVPVKSKASIIFDYCKMVVISIVILLTIVLLAMYEENRVQSILLSVPPDKPTTVFVDYFDEQGKMVGVHIMGPFQVEESCHKKDKPHVHVKIMEKLDDKETDLGEEWIFCLAKENQIEKAQYKEIKKTFDCKDKAADSEVFLIIQTKDVQKDITMLVTTNPTPIDQKQGIILGTMILVFLYGMIVTEIIDRVFASLICAGLSLAVLAYCNGKADQDHIIKWIDIETLALLVGMMLLVSILAESGIFDYFAVFAYKVAKGRVWALINCLSLFTAVLAMFLDSVTMMLLATPVIIRLCEVLTLDPVPVLITMVLFANVGAASTPVGDPPNVIISLNPYIIGNGVNFGTFTFHMFPGVLLALVQTYVHIRLLFRKPESMKFKKSKEQEDLQHEIAVWERTAAGISPYSQDEDVAREAIHEKIEKLKQKLADAEGSQIIQEPPSFEETYAELSAMYPLKDKPLIIKATVAFALVIFLFLMHSVTVKIIHVSLGWSALIGAFLLLIISDRRDLEAILVRIEWSTLLFFAALFIVMETLSLLGLIDLIGNFVVAVILRVDKKYQLALAIVLVLWVSGLASAFLDNIPVTTMMVKIIIRLSQDEKLSLPLHPLVWSLAFGACFGGNGTLIGASANVVTAGVSEQHGYKISFLRFFIVCFPIMLGNLAVATAYLLVAHVAFEWHTQ